MADSNILQFPTKKYSALKKSDVDIISKSIADTVYNTAHTKTAYESTERLNTLILLQKLCFNHSHHLRIKETNYDCFLKEIEKSLNSKNEDRYKSLPLVDTTKTVLLYYERFYGIQERRQAFVRKIQEYDRQNCAITDCIYKPTKSVYNCLNDLKLIQSQCNVEVQTKVVKNPSLYTRKNSVGLAYALLNFKNATADNLLLEILRHWSNARQLEPDKREFVNYLWENLGEVREEVLKFILENFKFVLEKTVINACTALLCNGDCLLAPNIQRIFDFCSNSERLRCTLKNLLYALYACSDYNVKLLVLIHKLEL